VIACGQHKNQERRDRKMKLMTRQKRINTNKAGLIATITIFTMVICAGFFTAPISQTQTQTLISENFSVSASNFTVVRD
jgi:hypothetical protein